VYTHPSLLSATKWSLPVAIITKAAVALVCCCCCKRIGEKPVGSEYSFVSCSVKGLLLPAATNLLCIILPLAVRRNRLSRVAATLVTGDLV